MGWIVGLVGLVVASIALVVARRARATALRRVRRLESQVSEQRALIGSIQRARFQSEWAGSGAESTRPVFLLSLPRAGSTLLQRMLAAHPGVATTPEPWALLPMVYGHVGESYGTVAEYDERISVEAVDDFLNWADSDRSALIGDPGERARDLYARAALGREVFLDKTPRYSLIGGRLPELFPESPIVVLWRDPLDVCSSIFETWPDERHWIWAKAIDLYAGLAGLCTLAEQHAARVHTLRYEDLTRDTEATMRSLCDAIGLDFNDRVLSPVRGAADPTAGTRLGDPTGRHAFTGVDAGTRPLRGLCNERRIAWCREWVDWIGPDRLSLMGYNADELHTRLDSLEPDGRNARPDRERDRDGRAWLAAREREIGRTHREAAEALSRGEW